MKIDQFTENHLRTWAYSYCADSFRAETVVGKITAWLTTADTRDAEYALKAGWPRVLEMANAAETYNTFRK